MNAWAMFFCAACQREKPLTERVKVGKNLSRCKSCAYKTRFPEKRSAVEHDQPYETPAIPDEVMAAYREASE